MRYWITTHWPPREDEPAFSSQSGLWFPEGRHKHAHKVSASDLVVIYQAKSGRPLLRATPGGGEVRVKCRPGREGVIALGRVTAPVMADPTSTLEHYAGGSSIWWRWHAPVEILSSTGFINRGTFALLLGYKPDYVFRAFGDNRSGVKEIDATTYSSICAAFGSSFPVAPVTTITMPGTTPVPGAGESAAHRLLKLYVADNPSLVLGEPGLKTVQCEHCFPTGDRADVVLIDQFNRIIGVEIEPQVGDSDVVGPLQAIKYRRMLEFSTKRMPNDSRSFLVAYKISAGMSARCKTYGIECFEVATKDVDSWASSVSVV